MKQRVFSGFSVALVIALISAVELTADVTESQIPNPESRIPDEATITHVLNRLTFGPRPGDVEKVRAIGLAAWIDQQLHPERIDDAAITGLLPALEPPPASADPQELRRFARQQIQSLAGEKILRATYSERQLQEVLVDFWFNHFNVYAGKGRTAEYLAQYEREAIRPHVFDRFRDLLEADAKSPAMLFYLDNWLSADPNAAERSAAVVRQQRTIRRPGPRRRFGFPPPPKRAQANAQNGKKRTRGLNENYGRELLELHTLGVEGGYTQKDVIEVARAFTGWTIDRGGTFRFVAAVHDTGEKIVLGHKIKAGGGIEDGETALDILAAHPATAHHIAYQLAQRLVADEPPAALVDRAAARFRTTNGDLREVVRTIVTSPEFQAETVRDAKFKTPFTLVVSTMRTTGATVSDTRALVQTLQQMGQPLYMCQPPTGYHNTADAWISAGGLVSRMNFATRLASGNMPGVTLPGNPPNDLALRLGSPEFQRF
ncbi:MAG TPA: DUF1800 domain-containing protein [Vicinamibacterales bacterium]|nr:DUF1800 domain-containing protein [Vicinamibacterales bacterium]